MDVPLLASRFLVEIGDRVVPVSGVRGLAYAPGQEPPATVGLRRSAGTDRTFLDWAMEPKARPMTVSLLGTGGEPAVRYVLVGARPVAWHGPDLDATSPDVAYEELVLAVERIDLR